MLLSLASVFFFYKFTQDRFNTPLTISLSLRILTVGADFYLKLNQRTFPPLRLHRKFCKPAEMQFSKYALNDLYKQ